MNLLTPQLTTDTPIYDSMAPLTRDHHQRDESITIARTRV